VKNRVTPSSQPLLKVTIDTRGMSQKRHKDKQLLDALAYFQMEGRGEPYLHLLQLTVYIVKFCCHLARPTFLKQIST
jgi:hypothetical protein